MRFRQTAQNAVEANSVEGRALESRAMIGTGSLQSMAERAAVDTKKNTQRMIELLSQLAKLDETLKADVQEIKNRLGWVKTSKI